MANKLALSIIISIILTTIIVSTVNVGVNLFLERPDYGDYCEDNVPKLNREDNAIGCEAKGEDWVEIDNGDGYCDTSAINKECNDRYDEALMPYNQIRFYIFAIIGFTLLLVGLFNKENLIQLTSLATGGILVTQGITMNSDNEAIVFISLILILIIFGILAWRVIKKK